MTLHTPTTFQVVSDTRTAKRVRREYPPELRRRSVAGIDRVCTASPVHQRLWYSDLGRLHVPRLPSGAVVHGLWICPRPSPLQRKQTLSVRQFRTTEASEPRQRVFWLSDPLFLLETRLSCRSLRPRDPPLDAYGLSVIFLLLVFRCCSFARVLQPPSLVARSSREVRVRRHGPTGPWGSPSRSPTTELAPAQPPSVDRPGPVATSPEHNARGCERGARAARGAGGSLGRCACPPRASDRISPGEPATPLPHPDAGGLR